MSPRRVPPVDAIVETIEAELADRVEAPISASAAEDRRRARSGLERARELQREFRAEPVGGRLLALKRALYWFVASSFDRQAKVVEELLPALEAMERELESLRGEVAELRARSASTPGERSGPGA